jgi:hypothetical protein
MTGSTPFWYVQNAPGREVQQLCGLILTLFAGSKL